MERARLDLDAARTKARKAASEKAAAAAQEVTQAHARYDQCYASCRAALETTQVTCDEGIQRLLAFATAQHTYHTAAAALAKDLSVLLTG